ncbi:trypsin-like peptidase domain-containing protein [Streptomyces sp. NPDC098781]|uniref:trypsin-like peptidase domain-containing protein n=1 Tax=Streptomyces sp. NPDC098781 TaxID=3366097 RepID=UPI003827AE00
MVELSPDDRSALIAVLKELPEFAREADRGEFVRNAGLAQLVTHVDLSGSPYVAASRLVTHALAYGRVSPEHEALGRIVNELTLLVGMEQRTLLTGILDRYGLMVPVAPQPEPSGALSDRDIAQFQEKIIGENTLRPVSFLAEGLRAAAAVAYVETRVGNRSWSGTGFLIAPGLLLTNHHVIGSEEQLRGSVFRFGFEDDAEGRARPVSEYRPAEGGLLHTSPGDELDYSLIAIDGQPGRKWGWLSASKTPPRTGDRVNIVQHPAGLPKQIALQHNRIAYQGGDVVQYLTSTLPGSSGSPVLDDQWHVVAIHHSGGRIPEPTTGRFFYRNEGILLSSVLAHLPDELRGQTSVPRFIEGGSDDDHLPA